MKDFLLDQSSSLLALCVDKGDNYEVFDKEFFMSFKNLILFKYISSYHRYIQEEFLNQIIQNPIIVRNDDSLMVIFNFFLQKTANLLKAKTRESLISI